MTDDNPNRCPHCGQTFVVATLLRLHINKEH